MADETLPSTPPQLQRNYINTPQLSGRLVAGYRRRRKRRRTNRNELRNKIAELEKNLKKERASKAKYQKKRLQRQAEARNTPRKAVRQLLQGRAVTPAVTKRFLFGKVLLSTYFTLKRKLFCSKY